MQDLMLSTPAHKCTPKISSHTKCHFCVQCGIYMSKTAKTKYHRSQRFNCADPYRLDTDAILLEMVRKQSCNRYYNGKACHLPYRSDMIGFIEELAGKLQYQESTFHLAVALMDGLLSQHTVEKRMIRLVSFMSIYLAAKLHESSEKIPDNKNISKLFDDKYTAAEIRHCENVFFKVLQYKINLKTPYTFIEYFLSKGVLSDKDLKKTRPNRRSVKVIEFEALVAHFTTIALKDYGFYKYTPIAVAASAIACARSLMNFDATWTDELEELTRVPFEAIDSCSGALLNSAIGAGQNMSKKPAQKFIEEESVNTEEPWKQKSHSSITTDDGQENEIMMAAHLSPDETETEFDARNDLGRSHDSRKERSSIFVLFQ